MESNGAGNIQENVGTVAEAVLSLGTLNLACWHNIQAEDFWERRPPMTDKEKLDMARFYGRAR